MAVVFTKQWKREYKKTYAILGSISGFTTYATNGVAFDVCGSQNLKEADTFVQLEADATYSYIYDKTNNKIIFIANSTGLELTDSTTISSVSIVAKVDGKRL